MRRSPSGPVPGLLLLFLLPCVLGVVRTPYADDPWIEVETPNFRLISNPEKVITLGVAERLEQFRAMARILTGAIQIESALPVRVFVFGDGDTWSHFQEQVGGGRVLRTQCFSEGRW